MVEQEPVHSVVHLSVSQRGRHRPQFLNPGADFDFVIFQHDTFGKDIRDNLEVLEGDPRHLDRAAFDALLAGFGVFQGDLFRPWGIDGTGQERLQLAKEGGFLDGGDIKKHDGAEPEDDCASLFSGLQSQGRGGKIAAFTQGPRVDGLGETEAADPDLLTIFWRKCFQAAEDQRGIDPEKMVRRDGIEPPTN